MVGRGSRGAPGRWLADRLLKLSIRWLNVVGYPLLLLSWRLFRPTTVGVVVLVRYQGQVLLVKHSYGPRRWTLPGGGVKRGESLEHAARREVREEVGISLGELVRHGEIRCTVSGRRDTTWVFSAEVADARFRSDTWEIEDARWCAIDRVFASGLALTPGLPWSFELAGL
jgi:ADP-ribose pyrophosphatase YjhB (NUDIX family)